MKKLTQLRPSVAGSWLGLIGFVLGLAACASHRDYPIAPVGIKQVKITDRFWLPRIQQIQRVTIPHCLDTCIKEGRLDNFLIAGGKRKGTYRGKMPFEDTDIYKIIEGAAYSLLTIPNPRLDATLDSIIAIIGIGQEPDGYLTTWLTIDPDNPPAWWVPKTGGRWTRLAASHELYNSGHLFEAAAAHFYATGKRNLLDIALKNAALLVETFGPGKVTQPPGHQIVETGLIKLYRITGDSRYRRLARYFLALRGDSTTHQLYGSYSQDHQPVTQQTEIIGHAVRAVYMYAGMTDIAALEGDAEYLQAVQRIWQNMVGRRIYLTGGIGSRHEGESLGADYELPNLQAYCETCAAIGNLLWNHRLFLLFGEGKYYDLVERILYNGLLAGIALDGKNFFYVNPLEADGRLRFNAGSPYRQPWFTCPCCPTNLVRFIPSLPGLVYATQDDTIYVNLFIGNESQVRCGQSRVALVMTTDYPWSGKVRLLVKTDRKSHFTLKVRLPGWARNEVLPSDLYTYLGAPPAPPELLINGRKFPYHCDKGYAVIARLWEDSSEVVLHLPLQVRRVVAHPSVQDDSNRSALELGPLVYCLEEVDNQRNWGKITLSERVEYQVAYQDELLGGVNVIKGRLPNPGEQSAAEFTAIPYYAWANRGVGKMKVWWPVN